jgi:hypothetical protein
LRVQLCGKRLAQIVQLELFGPDSHVRRRHLGTKSALMQLALLAFHPGNCRDYTVSWTQLDAKFTAK